MPEISRFLGVVILMHFREHNPPHFHALYDEHEAAILIDSLGLMQGQLPPRVLSLVVEWAGLHQAELKKNWESMRSTGEYQRIVPLV